jgi:hypothetical protein
MEADGRKDKKKLASANGRVLSTGKATHTEVGTIMEWLCCPENIPNSPTIAFFGKRRTGKSTSITNYAFHCMLDIPFGLVMTGTAFAGYWEQIIPKWLIIQDLKPFILDWLIARQQRLVKKYGKDDPRVPAFIIMDDVIQDQKTIRYNADLASFFVLGRHLKITALIASQYVKGVGPVILPCVSHTYTPHHATEAGSVLFRVQWWHSHTHHRL